MSTDKSQESLDKIISNIKSAINKQEKTFKTPIEDDSVVDLTDIVTAESLVSQKSAEEVSGYIKDISEKVVSESEDNNHILSDEEIKEVFKEVLKPYLQSWLNNNLSKIVKEVVEKEVKHVFDKARV